MRDDQTSVELRIAGTMSWRILTGSAEMSRSNAWFANMVGMAGFLLGWEQGYLQTMNRPTNSFAAEAKEGASDRLSGTACVLPS